MNESRWVVRKIRKGGRVKIGGKWYRPTSRWMEYDGRLDGMTYVFARYPNYGEEKDQKYRSFIYCCCPIENRGIDPEQQIEDPQIVDGAFNWMIWYTEDYCEVCNLRRLVYVDDAYWDYGVNGEQVQRFRRIEIPCPNCGATEK